MTGRVVMTLDVTIDEAREIADRLAGMPASFGQYRLPQMIAECGEWIESDGALPTFTIRTDASTAAGGPPTPSV